ncbi:MAG TPA: acyltransferase [Bryobacteraceae bacterium]|jgi:acetyltransferase-like isoleucine patch superfamily enzyme|nr:acyltransferase [Bryobacteraceae bacterium]
MSEITTKAAYWTDGELPPNVIAGPGAVLTAPHAFRRFKSRREQALRIGRDCMMDGVHFALGENAEVKIGDLCYFTNAVLLCELQISIGDYVTIGWNATIADSDFHPIAPAQRIADAIACSPASDGRPRPEILMRPVTIEDYVWIGPNATILKGVRLGAGCFIEPGALVTRDIPPRSRVLGNPARIIGEV